MGLDFDEPTLRWGLKHNFSNLPGGAEGRLCLLLGNVLQPFDDAKEIRAPEPQAGVRMQPTLAGEATVPAGVIEASGEASTPNGAEQISSSANAAVSPTAHGPGSRRLPGESTEERGCLGDSPGVMEGEMGVGERGKEQQLRHTAPDIICAFNFSTCCLLTRRELLTYFAGVHDRLGGRERGGGGRRRGGVFAMDLYGGTSSECGLKLQRRYGDLEVRGAHCTAG